MSTYHLKMRVPRSLFVALIVVTLSVAADARDLQALVAAAPGSAEAPAAKAPATFKQLPLGKSFHTSVELGEIAAKHESNGEKRIILTTVCLSQATAEVAEFVIQSAQNWLYHLHNVGRAHNALIIGTDAKTCDQFIANKVPCFTDHMSLAWLRAAKNGYLPGGRQGVIKWYFTDRLINLGYDVLYMDTDTVTLHDPFYEWEAHERYEFDFQALSDYTGKPDNRPWEKEARDCQLYNPGGPDPLDIPVRVCASTGLFYMRSTQPAKVFTKAMIAAITAEPQSWEAKLTQRVILAFTFADGDSELLKVRLLPVEKYANFGVYEERRRQRLPTEQIVVLHCGLMVTNYKPMKLTSYGKWKPLNWNYEVLDSFYTSGSYLVSKDDKLTQVVPMDQLVNVG